MNAAFRCSLIILFAVNCVGSSHAQLQWRKLDSPTHATLRSGVFLSDSLAIAIGDSNTIVRSTDGGNSWKLLRPDTLIRRLLSIGFNPSSPLGSPIVIAGDGYREFRSIDGGATWTLFTDNFPHPFYNFIMSVQVMNKDTFYETGGRQLVDHTSRGDIIRTTDGGASWNTLFEDSGYFDFRSMHCFPDGKAYTFGVDFPSTSGFHVFSSIDSGITWLQKPEFTSDTLARFIKMYFTDSLHGYVAGFTDVNSPLGRILFSSDGGNSWQNSQIPLMERVLDITFSDAGHGFACGDMTILFSTDAGVTWADAGYTGNGTFLSVSASHGKVFAVGENGEMELALLQNSSVAETVVKETNPFPNPMSEQTTIDLPDDSRYEISIFNALGNKAKVFTVTGSSATIEKSGLPSGYFTFRARNLSSGLITAGKLIIR